MLIKKLKSLLINTLLVLVSIIAALAALEVALRFTEYQSILQRHYAYPVDYFRVDEATGYDISRDVTGEIHGLVDHEYALFSNRYGCFDYQRQVPDEYALVLGDSFTWGYAELEKKWTTRLEELSGVFMLKCGVTGFGTRQELIKAEKTIREVGKNPKYLIVMHHNNDLTDDFVFPHRTVIGGHLVGSTKRINRVTGELSFFTREELQSKYDKFIAGSLSNQLRKLRYNLILYRLYAQQFKPYLKRLQTEKKPPRTPQDVPNRPPAETRGDAARTFIVTEAEPTLLRLDSREGAYDLRLVKYLNDYQSKWYQKAVADHDAAVRQFKDYANSLGAELLFIDIQGMLLHKRFDNTREYLGQSYYALSDDYPVRQQSRWKNDGHWDIEGNQQSAKYIYDHFTPVLNADRER